MPDVPRPGRWIERRKLVPICKELVIDHFSCSQPVTTDLTLADDEVSPQLLVWDARRMQMPDPDSNCGEAVLGPTDAEPREFRPDLRRGLVDERAYGR